jgi:DNA-binding transcriptional LysR family regulator
MEGIRNTYTRRVWDSFEHLRLFLDIVDQNSISRGAERNGITQSAASQQLQELEKTLGVTLLDRATRPFVLTPAGELYAAMSRDVLARHQAFASALDDLRGGLHRDVRGTVRVAAIYSVGLSGMSRLQVEFAKRYPAATLDIEYLHPDKVYEALRSDHAEIGLVSFPSRARDLVVATWMDEPMVVAVAPQHPLAGKRKVRPRDLAGYDFVSFDAELPIRRHIDRFLRQHGATVKLTMAFDNIPMVKEAIALGTHVSILPERLMEDDIRQGRLCAIPMTVPLKRPLGIVRRKGRQLSPAAERFVALLTATA